jgi:DNA-binding transcriptional LysR family regulator
LTPARSAGKLLSKYSDRLMSLAADASSAMKDLQNVKTGQMFIGASQTTGVYILPRLIRARSHNGTCEHASNYLAVALVTLDQAASPTHRAFRRSRLN